MILYHGTSTRYLPFILEHGLQPRSFHGFSNYKAGVASKPNFVYLTRAHAMFYAANAVKEPYEVLLLKLNVRAHELFPDEDFLANVLLKQEGRERTLANLIQRAAEVNPEDYQRYWRDSLKHMGTVACRPLRPERIVAHTTAPNEFQHLAHFGADTNPPATIGSAGAARYIEDRYRPRLELLLRVGWKKALATVIARERAEHEKMLGKLPPNERGPFL